MSFNIVEQRKVQQKMVTRAIVIHAAVLTTLLLVLGLVTNMTGSGLGFRGMMIFALAYIVAAIYKPAEHNIRSKMKSSQSDGE